VGLKGKCRWEEGLCMWSAWRPGRASHQGRRLYGGVLYMRLWPLSGKPWTAA
jgi:hypothetical protein